VLAGTLLQPLGLIDRPQRYHADALERKIELGLLPIARRDVERLQHIFGILPRLMDLQAPMRVQRNLLHRSSLPEALTWLDIHGDRPDVAQHWRHLLVHRAEHHQVHQAVEPTETPFRRPRRRRRRRNSERRTQN
jgi:hypothetical protein